LNENLKQQELMQQQASQAKDKVIKDEG